MQMEKVTMEINTSLQLADENKISWNSHGIVGCTGETSIHDWLYGGRT